MGSAAVIKRFLSISPCPSFHSLNLPPLSQELIYDGYETADDKFISQTEGKVLNNNLVNSWGSLILRQRIFFINENNSSKGTESMLRK